MDARLKVRRNGAVGTEIEKVFEDSLPVVSVAQDVAQRSEIAELMFGSILDRLEGRMRGIKPLL